MYFEFGKGIEFTATISKHETVHEDIFTNNVGVINVLNDVDNDSVIDTDEISGTYGVKTATNHPDTYNAAKIMKNPRYNKTGDNEINAVYQSKTNPFPFHPTKDWANPGCQHKEQWGPHPQQEE